MNEYYLRKVPSEFPKKYWIYIFKQGYRYDFPVLVLDYNIEIYKESIVKALVGHCSTLPTGMK